MNQKKIKNPDHIRMNVKLEQQNLNLEISDREGVKTPPPPPPPPACRPGPAIKNI